MNSEHHYIGTHRQNMSDKVTRGRTQRKLADVQASEVCRLRISGWPLRAISGQFGISKASVIAISKGATYTNVPSRKVDDKVRSGKSGRKFTRCQVEEIRRAWADGSGSTTLGRRFQVSGQTIMAIVNRVTYADVSVSAVSPR